MNFRIILGCLLLAFPVIGFSQDQGSNDQATQQAATLAQTMRAYQARYHTLKGYYTEWPSCVAGTKAPHFPSDTFYAADMEDPQQAAVLVQALNNAYWQGVDTNGDALHMFFLASPPEGQPNLTLYTNSQFTPQTSTSAIDTTNYATVLSQLSGFVQKLQQLPFSNLISQRTTDRWGTNDNDDGSDPDYSLDSAEATAEQRYYASQQPSEYNDYDAIYGEAAWINYDSELGIYYAYITSRESLI